MQIKQEQNHLGQDINVIRKKIGQQPGTGRVMLEDTQKNLDLSHQEIGNLL